MEATGLSRFAKAPAMLETTLSRSATTLALTSTSPHAPAYPETTHPGSEVTEVLVECSAVSPPGRVSPCEPCRVVLDPEQENIEPAIKVGMLPHGAASSKLRSCGMCSQRVGCSRSSIFMAFDQPFCSSGCRKTAVLKHFNRALSAGQASVFDLPPSITLTSRTFS